jgi:dihydroflavonol-4-reductase
MSELALVTGGTGFVGSAVVRALLARGTRVRALVRPGSDRSGLAGLEVELAQGDLLDPASLARAAAGAGLVFHVAAEYRLWHPRPREVLAVNVEGTRNLLAAARAAGVQRFVHTSSVATLAIRADGRPSDEEQPARPEELHGAYKRSKFLAEQAVLAERELDVVVVQPTAPVGPRDKRPTPTGRMVLDAAAGRMPAYVDTGLNVVHVDDVAAGHLLAAERGRRGERYILGERNLSLLEIVSHVATGAGRRPPRLRLEPGWLLPLAHLAELGARFSGGDEPRLTVAGLRLAQRRMYFTSDKARSELGYAPRPGTLGLDDAVTWFREHGYLG